MKSASNIKALVFDFFLSFLMPLGCFKNVFFLQFLSLCLLFRCLQFMSEKEVEAYVLIILHARIVINKKGGRNHIPLPKNAMLF